MRKLLGLVAVAAACTSYTRPRPDDMSAEAHRREAAKERNTATEHMAEYRADAPMYAPLIPGDFDRSAGPNYPYAPVILNPTADHLYLANRHLEHAREHEEAAAALESFEDQECAAFGPIERAACPLVAGVEDLIDVPGGVRIRFAGSIDVARTVAHMRCHLAYARTRGFEVVEACPLYVRGVHVERIGESRVIDVLAGDTTTARSVRQRAREEAVRTASQGGGR